MAVKKVAVKAKKEAPKKSPIKGVASPKLKKIESEKKPEEKIKVVEKKREPHLRIQTAEGWKRMMRKLKAKK